MRTDLKLGPGTDATSRYKHGCCLLFPTLSLCFDIGRTDLPIVESCRAVAAVTGCLFPIDITDEQRDSLQAQLRFFLDFFYPEVNITSLAIFPNDDRAFFVARSTQALPAAFDLALFADPELCQNRSEIDFGTTRLTRTLVFVDAECRLIDLDALDFIQRLVAAELDVFGVLTSDVSLSINSCQPTVLDLELVVGEMAASNVLQRLQAANMWTRIYAALVQYNRRVFADIAEALEYAPGKFVPEDEGSGSGDG